MSVQPRGAATRARFTVGAALGAVVVSAGVAGAGPVFAAGHAGALQISKASDSLFGTAAATQARVTQMAWGPDGRLYASTNGRGVLRMEYNPATGALSNLAQVSTINGNGIAFHGQQMFLTSSYTSPDDANPGNHFRLSSLWRLSTADTGDTWGGAIPIVQGIPQHDHGANNIQIRGNTLTLGNGTRTRNGAADVPPWYGAATLDSFGESAYGGAILQIENLDALDARINALGGGSGAANVAGFYAANPISAQYQALIQGTDPAAKSVYTSDLDYKLKVHSAGARNPFGLDIDGDGNIWFTNNWQRGSKVGYSENPDVAASGDGWDGNGFQDDVHDQFFKAVRNGDYGFRNDNWRQDGADGGGNPALNNAPAFFAASTPVHSLTFDNLTGPDAEYDSANPVGLGPSSSSNGFDIYDGNALPIGYHKKAFITRWNGTISDGGDTITYHDLVMVDLNDGTVRRVVHGLANPLAVLTAPDGSLLVAEYSGEVYRITPTAAAPATHGISWTGGAAGEWSDAGRWTATADPTAHLVPAQWGQQKYDVTLAAGGVVTLDRDATIHGLLVAGALRITAGNDLSIQGNLAQGADSDGIIFELAGPSDDPRLVVGGTSSLRLLVIDVPDDATLAVGDRFRLLASAQGITGGLPTLDVLDPRYAFDLEWVAGNSALDAVVTSVPEPATITSLAFAGFLLVRPKRPSPQRRAFRPTRSG